MARKVAEVTQTDAGRDHGKTYVITEMPASQGERWAMRAFFAMAKAQVDIPESIARAGLAGIASMNLKELVIALAAIPFEEAEPLMNEMFMCVKRMEDSSGHQLIRNLVEDDIEEIGTRLMLREAILGLHLNFSTPAVA